VRASGFFGYISMTWTWWHEGRHLLVPRLLKQAPYYVRGLRSRLIELRVPRHSLGWVWHTYEPTAVCASWKLVWVPGRASPTSFRHNKDVA